MVILAMVVVGAGLVMMFVGAWTVGVTWDERTHVVFLQTFFDIGWNIDPIAIVDDVPDPRYIWGVYVYGPVGELVAHAVSTLLGAEEWGEPVYTALSGSTRHLGIALMATAGIVAAGGTVGVITRSWRWGVIGAAVLASVPVWIGHGMFNIKDTPVASGYTIATLGMVMLLRSDLRARRGWHVLAAVLLVVGTVLAAGTRAAVGVPIAAGAVLGVLALWWFPGRESESLGAALRPALVRLGEFAALLAGGYLILALLYPKAFANPVELAWQALVVSARFPFDEQVLTAGTWLDQPPPWTYLPWWFGAQLPLLVSIAALVFIAWWAWGAARLTVGRSSSTASEDLALPVPVLSQAFLLATLAVIGRSSMYNGQRQFLFVVPAAAILATLGIWWTARWASQRADKARWLVPAVWAASGVGIIVPTVAQAFLFPYNYTYYNAAVAVRPIEGHWPTDYWRASSNELLRRLPADGPEACAYESFRYDEVKQCRSEGMFVPYLNERGIDAKPGSLGPGEIWLVRENQGVTDLPPGCRLHDEITRPLFGQDIVIGQILACPLPDGWTIPEDAA
jgi:hypothetical protein